MVDRTQQPKPSLGKWKRIDEKVFEVTAVSRQRALEIASWLLHAPADEIVIKPLGDRPHYTTTVSSSAKQPRKYRVSVKPIDGVFQLTVEGNAVFLQVDEARHAGRPVVVDQVLQELGGWPVSGVDTVAIARTIDLADWSRAMIARLVIPPDAPTNGVAILVSEDKMRAFALARGRATNSPIARDELEAALAKAGVVAGIREDEIDAFLSSRSRGRPVLVAQGGEPIEGELPAVTWLVGLVPGPHGEPVPMVEPGDAIARVKPGKPSEPGATVTGQAIPVAARSSDVLGVAGSGVTVSEDGEWLRATMRGKPTVQEGNVVVVLPVQVVEDVTGTLDLATSALIRGPVAPGSQVRAGGDADVVQGIQDVTIRSGGSIVVGGDVAGKCLLSATRDIVMMSVYGGVVKSGGTVRIRGEAIQATIWAERRVVVSGRGRIDGGLVRAGEEIVAGTVGNAQGRATRVVVTGGADGQTGRITVWQAVLPGTIVRVGRAELEIRAPRGPTTFEVEREKIVIRPVPAALLGGE